MELLSREWNAVMGKWEEYWYDPSTEVVTIKNTYDVSDVLELNKRSYNAADEMKFGNGMMHHMAEIPLVFVKKFLDEHNLDVFSNDPSEQLRLRKLLESSEYRFLKTDSKKLWRPT